MYRAYVYFNLTGAVEDGIRLNSESFPTEAQANGCLQALLELPKVTGGDIEQKVPGIGWVICDEVETATYLHRLHESDRSFYDGKTDAELSS